MAKSTPRPLTRSEEKGLDVAVKAMSKLNVWLFRASGGRLGNKFMRGAPVLLLTTTGRKSGQPRTTPLIYLTDGDDVVIVASKAGSSFHPLWYLNLVADPAVEIEIGSEKRAMRAHTASAEEKQKLWPRLLDVYRDYDDYQARSPRDIPVVILSPV